MSRSLPKKNNPLILADAAPAYDDLLSRRRLGKTNLSVKPGQIGTSNATKPENLGLFEYAHLRAPLPKDLKGSEIFPSHNSQQHPDTYFLMRRSKDGFVSATGMFKIAFPWAKIDEERIEREYLKSREYTSQEEVAGNVWISPLFALELSREYQMYDWVRALLDPKEIVQSPKKQITPPPKFEMPSEIPSEEQSIAQRRSRRSVSPSKMSPSKKSASPRKSRQPRTAKDAPNTPSTNAANDSLQKALETTISTVETDFMNGVLETVEEEEAQVKTTGSPEKKRGRKPKKVAAEAEEVKEKAKDVKKEEAKEEKKEKKTEKKKKQDAVEPEPVKEKAVSKEDATVSQATVSLDLDVPFTLPEVPSAQETEDMIAKAKEMVEDAIKAQAAENSAAGSTVQVTKKRKPEDDEDEETSAEASQRAKKAKVLEDKLKRERVRNRALFGVSAAFALAASIPYFL